MGNNNIQNEIEEKFYIKNNDIDNTVNFKINEINSSFSVYEVIRVAKAVPLFLEEHLNRLNHSLKLSNYAIRFDVNLLKQQIHRLIHINGMPEKNIKIVVNNLDQKPNLFLYFIPSKYPFSIQYEKGVSTILYLSIRENPNIKTIVLDQRQKINEAIKNSNVYEAILVNENNRITEGSRSNIFLVKSNSLYTAPASEVLKGVTRSRVINLCQQLNIPVIEQPISIDFLYEAEGLFLTGTSPKILPIELVNKQRFSSSQHPLILKLCNGYNQLIDEYIKDYK